MYAGSPQLNSNPFAYQLLAQPSQALIQRQGPVPPSQRPRGNPTELSSAMHPQAVAPRPDLSRRPTYGQAPHMSRDTSQRLSTRQRIGDPMPCAKCSRTGHTLATCIGPPTKVYGDIHGCPHCNSVMHLFDHCSVVQGGDGVEPRSRGDKFKFLVHYRQDKPLIPQTKSSAEKS